MRLLPMPDPPRKPPYVVALLAQKDRQVYRDRQCDPSRYHIDVDPFESRYSDGASVGSRASKRGRSSRRDQRSKRRITIRKAVPAMTIAVMNIHPGTVPDGSRYRYLLALSEHLHDRGCARRTVAMIVSESNRAMPNPLSLGDMMQIMASLYRDPE